MIKTKPFCCQPRCFLAIMGTMKITVVLLIVLLTASLLPALDLEQLYRGALENDRQTLLLQMSRENQELRIRKGKLESPFHISVGTGSSDVSFSQAFASAPGGSSTVISLKPFVEMDFGGSAKTGIDLQLPMSFTFAGGVSSYTVSPSLAVTQPLNSLLGLAGSAELEELQEFYGLEDTRIGLLSREFTVKKTLLGHLKKIKLLERSLVLNERGVASSETELDKVTALGTYSEESAKYKQLQVNLERMKRDRLQLQRTGQKYWADLSKLVGQAVNELPAPLPEAMLEPPADPDGSWNPDLYFAWMDERIAGLQLASAQAEFIPQFSMGGSYGLSVTDFSSVSGHSLGITFSGTFEDLSVFGSFGGNLSGRSMSAAFGFAWSQPDHRADDLTLLEKENSLASARLRLEAAQESFEATVESLREEILDIENRRLRLEESRMLAELELEEAKSRFDLGIVNEDVLDASSWAVENLACDEYVLVVDRLLLQLDIEEFLLLKAD